MSSIDCVWFEEEVPELTPEQQDYLFKRCEQYPYFVGMDWGRDAGTCVLMGRRLGKSTEMQQGYEAELEACKRYFDNYWTPEQQAEIAAKGAKPYVPNMVRTGVERRPVDDIDWEGYRDFGRSM